MKKDILVSISGLQYEVDMEETIEVISIGEYFNRNDKHYILYQEMFEEADGISNCTLKIGKGQVDIIKRGTSNVHMIFEENKKNTTLYNTPFGDLQIGVYTTDINVTEEEDKITANIKYGLDVNYSHVSDCEIQIKVTPRNGGALRESTLS